MPGLAGDEARHWGATLEGDVVIRRSAVGLDRDRRILFMGISNATTARAFALGMKHGGAWTVGQLDVNWSYPKFLIYVRSRDGIKAQGVIKGFLFHPDDYVRKPSPRDFFYLVRKFEAAGAFDQR